MWKNFHKLPVKLVGGAVFSLLVIAGAAIAFATPAAPTPPAATDCTACQSIQVELDAAYADLTSVVADVAEYGSQVESLLSQTTEIVYAGDTAMMVDHLQQAVIDGTLAQGPLCQDPGNSFAYYSSFTYEDTVYCIINEDMWFGTDPDYFNFYDHMAFLTEGWDAGLSASWDEVWHEMLELLTDHDGNLSPNVEDLLALIETLLGDLSDCEDENCPGEPECPDCEAIAADLQDAMDNLEDLEAEADTLDAELSDLETEIDKVYDQLAQWDQLRAEFEAMVEDAGGKHGADCDGFEVQSGQAWGIAHNFGNVQWCFTSEAQIEEMINNLDEYWKTHKSSHLPSEAALNAQLDALLSDYVDALFEYQAVLDDIAAAYDEIDLLASELDDCLTELAALQLEGYCLDQDMGPMEDLLDDADAVLGTGYEPEEPEAETPEEETPEEGEEGSGEEPGDIAGHWAEDFIKELFNAGVVSGDDATGDFRPDDPVNRAEAAKIVSLAHGDDAQTCDSTYFPDVLADSWFCIFTTNAFDMGYFEGYEDGTFGPANPILRAEAAAVVLRALGFTVPEYTSYSFPDITGDEWYADYAQRAYECGLMQGRDVNGVKMFAGTANITRAELAKIVDLALVQGMDEATACGAG